MTEQDLKIFTPMFCELCMSTGKEPSESLTRVFFKHLKKYEIETIALCFERMIATEKTFPSVARINEVISGGTPEELASRWYDIAYDAIQRYGSYESVCFDDPATGKAISAMGGWTEFCILNHDQWTRKEFERLHRTYRNEKENTVLYGLTAKGNVFSGFQVPDVRYIGFSYLSQKNSIRFNDRNMLEVMKG